MRKLVTVRKVEAIEPIKDADRIEVAVFGGWRVVVGKGSLVEGQDAVYIECDAFLPAGDPRWQSLIERSSTTFNGVSGHKLRTARFKGVYSQGFALGLTAFPEIVAAIDKNVDIEEQDFSELLKIVKWEAPEPHAVMAGLARGNFPSFIPKTDQERAQNMKREIFEFESTEVSSGDWISGEIALPKDHVKVEAEIAGSDTPVIGFVTEISGNITRWKPRIVRPPKGRQDRRYEVTMKMDGSSTTVYYNDGNYGVCSRNLELKIEGNEENAFVKIATVNNLQAILTDIGRNIAIQFELMAPGIQGNREAFTGPRGFIFDVFDIDAQCKLLPAARLEYVQLMRDTAAKLGLSIPTIVHAPVLYTAVSLEELGITNIDELIQAADGPSLVNPVREGLVFKSVDDNFTFKAISNKYLAKLKE